jgi:hypothetical protein
MDRAAELRQVLDAFVTALGSSGGETLTFSISDPITELALSKAEKALGFAFPPRLRRFLTTTSGGMEFSWKLDDDHEITLEGERDPIGFGEFTWSFDELVSDNERFRGQDIEGDDLLSEMVGRDKIILTYVPNGDMFAVGVSGELADKILYLSHEGEDVHNYVVASDIDDLMCPYAPLGLAGPECWIWEQFTNGRTTMIDPSSRKAMAFLASLDRRA